jgi:hypothetical protein
LEATIDCTAWASLINGEIYIGDNKKLEAISNILKDKIYQKVHFLFQIIDSTKRMRFLRETVGTKEFPRT